MKVTKQRVRNWRSHLDTEIAFGDAMTIFSGPQGAGKSSCVYALAFTLIGRTPNTSKDGKGVAKHIREGQVKAEISADCVFNGAGAVQIGRTITESGQTIDAPWGKGVAGRQTLILDRMGVADEAAECLLDPTLFADRKPDEQAQTLLKLLREPVIESPKEAQAVGIRTLSGIQQVDDQIKSLKDGNIRALNAVIDSLEEALPEEVSSEQHADAVQAISEASQLEAKVRQMDREAQNATYRLQEGQKLLAEIEQAAGQCQDLDALHAKREEALVHVKQFSDEASVARTKIESKEREYGEATGRWSVLTAEEQAVTKLHDKCPTCLRSITQEDKEAISKRLYGPLREIRAKTTGLKAETENARKELSAVNEKGRQARTVYDVLTSQIADAERFGKLSSQPKPDVDGLTAKEKDAKAVAETCRVNLAAARGKADVCRDTLRRKEERETSLVTLEKNRSSRESYRLAVESLEKLKSGILSGEGAKKLEVDAQEVIEKILPGEKLILSSSGASLSGIPVSHLSSGQKVIFDCCLRIAAARNTGFNLLALDDASKLPVSTRARMFNALLASGCQVILCTTQDKIQVPAGVVAYQFSSPGVKGPTSVVRL